MTTDTVELLQMLHVATIDQTDINIKILGALGVLIVIGVWVATWPLRGKL